MVFSRDAYLKKLTERQNNGLIKIITGARRAGKSYLMNELYYQNDITVLDKLISPFLKRNIL